MIIAKRAVMEWNAWKIFKTLPKKAVQRGTIIALPIKYNSNSQSVQRVVFGPNTAHGIPNLALELILIWNPEKYPWDYSSWHIPFLG